MPPRGLHLPRLNASRPLRAGATAGAIVLAALFGVFLLVRRVHDAPDPTDRQTVALLLYGQTDPDNIHAAGLHGLGGGLIQVGLTQVGPCRFRLAGPQTYDEIDFGRVTAISVALVRDPAAGLIDALGAGRRTGLTSPPPIPQLALVQLTGSDDAICGPQQCVGHRAFALSDVARIDAARDTAADFYARLCHQS